MLRPAKSWMGEISANSSFNPSRRNHSKESSWTLIRLGMGATSAIRANECRAAPSVTARETGRASASAIGRFSHLRVVGDDERDIWENNQRAPRSATYQRNVKRKHR